MIDFAKGICLLLIASEVILVQCEPKHFAKENKHIHDVVREHASQQYSTTKRKIDENNFIISGTKAEKIWMYIRHGTCSLKRSSIPILERLESVAKQIVEKFENDQSVPFTRDDWQRLKTWKLNFTSGQNSAQKLHAITKSGREELELIAVNYQKRFPGLLTGSYSPDKFNLRHSVLARTKQSMEIFFGKIFGQNVAEAINGTAGPYYEGIVEAYRKYDETVQSDKRPVNVELSKFQDSTEFRAMLERIAEKFHLQTINYSEKQELISNIFDMCSFEETYLHQSAWCSFFEANDILMLQYAVDLYNFYEWGYGFEQNDKIQCPTIRDMVEHLENGTAPVSAYFSHAPEVSLHLVAMHAYREHQKLTAENYRGSTSVWRGYKLIPYAANFAAVFYNNKQVKFFMNEELIELSWCKRGTCNLKDLRTEFSYCF